MLTTICWIIIYICSIAICYQTLDEVLGIMLLAEEYEELREAEVFYKIPQFLYNYYIFQAFHVVLSLIPMLNLFLALWLSLQPIRIAEMVVMGYVLDDELTDEDCEGDGDERSSSI